MPKNLPTAVAQSFEDIKQTNEHGAEYWSARDLQNLLGYSQWRRFEDVIKRAITSCKESGNPSEHHFADVGKMIELGKGGVREVDDYHLSRFACYLIAQNGNPQKPEIAYAQRYFAIQTRKQELSEQLAADLERLELRKQTAEEFKALSGAAQQAGVQNRMFGVFHDAGYKGLYGGMGKAKPTSGLAKKSAKPSSVSVAHYQNTSHQRNTLKMLKSGSSNLHRKWSLTNGMQVVY